VKEPKAVAKAETKADKATKDKASKAVKADKKADKKATKADKAEKKAEKTPKAPKAPKEPKVAKPRVATATTLDHIKFWEAQFGKKDKGLDFSGREVVKAEFKTADAKAWDIEFIMPFGKEAKGGLVDGSLPNLQIVHLKTQKQRGGQTHFSANGKSFQVRKTKKVKPANFAGKYDYSKTTHCIVEVKQEAGKTILA